jgi:phosphoadenosine phosphosulfate reductase
LVIRGQRNAERAKSPIRSGHKDGGVEYLFPIEDWSSQQVRDYLKEQGAALPRHYDYVDTSLDCQHCTGYLFENAGKFEFIRQHHPALHVEVQGQLRQIYLAAQNEMSHLTRVMRT